MLFLSIQQALSEADIHILHSINSHRLAWLTPFFVLITNTVAYVSITALLIILTKGYVNKNKTLIKKGWFLTVGYILAVSTSSLIKVWVNRTRPFESYPFIEKLSVAGNASFPSGHTTDAFVTAVGLCLFFNQNKYKPILLLWAAGVGYSRMYLGVHYPSDVLGGAVLGATMAYVVFRIYTLI